MSDADALRSAETWFLEHGLPYFVDDVRAEIRRRLSRPRVVLVLLVALLGGLAAGVGVGLVSDSGSFGFAVGAWVAAGVAAAYALFALRMHDIAGWALKRAFASLGPALPARHPGPADAADLRDVPVHQHRGLAGDLGDGRGRHLGRRAVLRARRHWLPGGAARRGARPVRRRHLGRDVPRRHRRHASGTDGAAARRRGHRPAGRGRGHGSAEGQPGARPARGSGRAGAAAGGRGVLLLHPLRRRGHRGLGHHLVAGEGVPATTRGASTW